MTTMQTKTFEIIKKNRVYFAAKTGGYACKLKITDATKDLDVGQHTLLVSDVSVRTKYGTDLIFEVQAEVDKADGIVTLKHFAYNANLVNACRELGGNWDRDASAWVFPKFVEDKVEELDEQYNTDVTAVEITTKDSLNVCCGAVKFLGYTVARATGRDSGAELGDGVACLSGKYSSGGSVKNWSTVVSEGAVFRLKVPRKLFEGRTFNSWSVKAI